jgi:hypothetical protein
MGNPFVHIELNTTDLAKAKSFYKDLFDWKLEEMPMEGGRNYTMIVVGEGTGGGMMTHPMPGAPSMWLPYVEVADVAKTTEKVESLGGKVKVEPTEIKDAGWFSIVVDPTGAVLGLWTGKK